MPLKPVDIPKDLTSPCAELSELTDITGKYVLNWALQAVHDYNDCKARHSALVKAISQK